ncbi:MAG: energy transducer TonB [Rhodospirillales bacterium]
MEIRVRHWNTAIIGAVFLHAATAAAVLWTPAAPGAQLPGVGGIEISLGPAGGAHGADAKDSPEPQEAKPVEPVETVEAVTPEVPAEAVPIVEPVIPDAVAIEPVKAVEERPRDPLPVPPKVVRPKAAPPPKPVETAAVAPAPVHTPPPAIAGSQGKSGTKDAKETGSGDNSQGGGLAGAAADYMSVLQAWLEKHKEYPRSARLRRIEGAVLLYFAIDRDGHLLAYRIERSSGHRMLDTETIAMINRAQPLPPIPNDMSRDKLEVVVPVQFSLR